MNNELTEKEKIAINADVGVCSDCLYGVCDGDLGFVCANRKSKQWGSYSSGCELYEEG